MKSNELRIGNYVLLTKDNFKTTKQYELTGIDIYKLDESECVDIKPIPLTEEWFLKLGFVIRYFNEDKNKPLWWKVEGNRHIELHFEKYVLANVFMINSLQYSIGINSVHQLQNLYFALTGKELVYND